MKSQGVVTLPPGFIIEINPAELAMAKLSRVYQEQEARTEGQRGTTPLLLITASSGGEIMALGIVGLSAGSAIYEPPGLQAEVESEHKCPRTARVTLLVCLSVSVCII